MSSSPTIATAICVAVEHLIENTHSHRANTPFDQQLAEAYAELVFTGDLTEQQVLAYCGKQALGLDAAWWQKVIDGFESCV